MPDEYALAQSKMEDLISWYADNCADRNEATTRLHLIDTLFFDCLAWSKRSDVTVEDVYNGDYCDYTFRLNRPVLIVEAKREGKYFEVPAAKDKRIYSLAALKRNNQPLEDALDQVAKYCQSRGVTMAVVTNGHQLVAFIATRSDGVPPLDGEALVYTSLKQMGEKFIEVWNYLSKHGIQQQNLHRKLIGETAFQIPPKLSSSIANYPGTQIRNSLQADLQWLSETILEDITTRDLEPKFLRQCYCPSGALSQYSLISKNILRARYSSIFGDGLPGPSIKPAVDKLGITDDFLAQSMSLRPILIIGDVGVGKTTFIKYHYKVDAADLFKEILVLYIDLGSQANLTDDIKNYVLTDIIEQLRYSYEIDVEEKNFVRGVYNVELERFSRGIYGDLKKSNLELFKMKEIEFLEEKLNNREQHLKYCFNHLVKGRGQQIVMFIDNVDQREYAAQQQAFLISHEFAQHWPVTVYTTLRPETFHESLKRGALTGYHPKAFTIAPPRIDQVLTKRLDFALRLTAGELQLRQTPGINLKLDSLDTVIRVFMDSLGRDRDLIRFIDNVSSGNVRRALDMVRNFFGSGHVDMQKIIDIYESTGRYYVPLHEFVRAVIYGDSRHYDPSRSLIGNLYDVVNYDPREHFLLPELLSILSQSSGQGQREGFIESEKIYDHVQSLGFTPEQLDATILRGYSHNLIESSGKIVSKSRNTESKPLRLTSAGAYHITDLCNQFTYYDAIIVDTPIFDNDIRAKILDSATIVSRLERATILRDYFDTQWAALPGEKMVFQWPSVSARLKKEIENISNKLNRSMY